MAGRDRKDPRIDNPDEEYLRLAEPWESPEGLVVETMGSRHGLFEIGLHFHNALELPGFADRYVNAVGERHVYRVLLDGVPLSCGEILAEGDGVKLVWDRSHDNRNGSPETLQAAEGFVAAINAGDVDLNYEIDDGRFVARAPGPRP